jgi:hypothetical protein
MFIQLGPVLISTLCTKENSESFDDSLFLKYGPLSLKFFIERLMMLGSNFSANSLRLEIAFHRFAKKSLMINIKLMQQQKIVALLQLWHITNILKNIFIAYFMQIYFTLQKDMHLFT